MKFARVLVFSLLLVPCSSVWAEEAHEAGPCKTIKAACEAAGFKLGAHKENGKGLHLDCMKPILEGKIVAGVTVSGSDVAACKAKKEAHEQKKK